MSHPSRKRFQLSPGSELLETRQLLNAHMPHHPAANVASVSPKVIHQLSGTLTGQENYTLRTSTPALQVGDDVYNMHGRTNHGAVTFTGTDTFSSRLVAPSTFSDTYHGGNATLTLSDGSTIAISFVATGHSKESGQFDATYQGKAIGTSGAMLGHIYSFKATSSGLGNDHPATLKFSLKG